MDTRERDLLHLRMIDLAQQRGGTWNSIAKALGVPDGKTLKNRTKRLARRLEREFRDEAQAGGN